ncbi:hypothetical protein DIPPA_34789 [Diplonema papillatum]|nr:hypothetical protein DIPPA_34789 [Diplonema papillatum]
MALNREKLVHFYLMHDPKKVTCIDDIADPISTEEDAKHLWDRLSREYNTRYPEYWDKLAEFFFDAKVDRPPISQWLRDYHGREEVCLFSDLDKAFKKTHFARHLGQSATDFGASLDASPDERGLSRASSMASKRSPVASRMRRASSVGEGWVEGPTGKFKARRYAPEDEDGAVAVVKIMHQESRAWIKFPDSRCDTQCTFTESFDEASEMYLTTGAVNAAAGKLKGFALQSARDGRMFSTQCTRRTWSPSPTRDDGSARGTSPVFRLPSRSRHRSPAGRAQKAAKDPPESVGNGSCFHGPAGSPPLSPAARASCPDSPEVGILINGVREDPEEESLQQQAANDIDGRSCSSQGTQPTSFAVLEDCSELHLHTRRFGVSEIASLTDANQILFAEEQTYLAAPELSVRTGPARKSSVFSRLSHGSPSPMSAPQQDLSALDPLGTSGLWVTPQVAFSDAWEIVECRSSSERLCKNCGAWFTDWAWVDPALKNLVRQAKGYVPNNERCYLSLTGGMHESWLLPEWKRPPSGRFAANGPVNWGMERCRRGAPKDLGDVDAALLRVVLSFLPTRDLRACHRLSKTWYAAFLGVTETDFVGKPWPAAKPNEDLILCTALTAISRSAVTPALVEQLSSPTHVAPIMEPTSLSDPMRRIAKQVAYSASPACFPLISSPFRPEPAEGSNVQPVTARSSETLCILSLLCNSVQLSLTKHNLPSDPDAVHVITTAVAQKLTGLELLAALDHPLKLASAVKEAVARLGLA